MSFGLQNLRPLLHTFQHTVRMIDWLIQGPLEDLATAAYLDNL